MGAALKDNLPARVPQLLPYPPALCPEPGFDLAAAPQEVEGRAAAREDHQGA